jgi:hypothetical protein
MSDKRMPWMKFFTRDWRAAPKLRMCSFAARGLWIDLLSLMAESIPRGFLLIEGKAPTPLQIARLLSAPDREVKKLLEELAMNKVFSITGREMSTDVRRLIPANMPDGVIMSPRMVREEAKRKIDTQKGRTGGNPRLKTAVNPRLKRMFSAEATRGR